MIATVEAQGTRLASHFQNSIGAMAHGVTYAQYQISKCNVLCVKSALQAAVYNCAFVACLCLQSDQLRVLSWL